MRALILVLLLAIPSTASAGNAIAYGETGIRVGADVVVKGKVDGAAYDPAMDLVWFTTKGTLQVLDLRTPKAKPVVIVKKMPDVGFWVNGASTASWNTDYTAAYMTLDLTKKKPKLAAGEGAYGPVDQDATDKLKKKIKKAKLVGQRWLAKLAKRPLSAVTIPTPAPQPNVTLPADMCHADDVADCGSSISFGTTAYQLVTTELSCGDACYTACALYDPKTKKWADPDAPDSKWDKTAESGPCDGYFFDSDGKTYVNTTMRCTLGSPIQCSDDTPWAYIGITP